VGGFNGIQQEIRRQAGCLVTWAQQRDLLLTDAYFLGLQKYERGTLEHDVYFGLKGRVIKCTKPGAFGRGHGSNGKYGNHCPATPLFYLERLELMNQEFPTTDLCLEGIALGKSEYEDREVLHPYIITSQRYIEIVDERRPHPSEPEIENFMRRLGFSLIQDSCYNWIRESDGIIVTDTKMLNFIISHEGIVPIDLIISRRI
jgi:hypothetical protein